MSEGPCCETCKFAAVAKWVKRGWDVTTITRKSLFGLHKVKEVTRDRDTKRDEIEIEVYCHRYPECRQCRPDHWCGEYRKKAQK